MAATRILTTHAGSLPRPPDLSGLMLSRSKGEPVNLDALKKRVAEATREVVRKQAELGIDIVSDGEYGKASYVEYVKDRLSGFSGPPDRRGITKDWKQNEFPDWAPDKVARLPFPTNNGAVSVADGGAILRDIDNFRDALKGAAAPQAFMTAASPGVVALFMPSTHYASQEDYLRALGSALKAEYRAIVSAGFTLQVDCPDLAAGFRDHIDAKVVDLHIDVLNEAFEGLPREQLRLHVCWGNYEGPHTHDVPLKELMGPLLRARVGAFSFEAANPRHAHEWTLFEEMALPEGVKIIPGVIDNCTNYVEHPELVAQRLLRFARAVGPENVIAGTDCGFGTTVEPRHVPASICWAKLRSMVEGARLASAQL
ncbi:MAG: epoxyalkane--coenzyme M transferase [Betaproteobacteria bacterium]|nr:epoxyalkane--coenzyme M transferase [Betaproteobacteria bacterium]